MNRVSTELLLQHGPFLRGLALALLHDPGHADDVVQEAYLAALRGGPTEPSALRPWLARVVSNLARKVRRTEGRRSKREARVAAADYVRPTADIVAAESARREVVRGVLALREPYRTALLLRFYDDLPPREIARQLGVSGSTVRSRLQRGLLELRGHLDQTHGNRRAWCLALLPWVVPAHAAAATPVLMTGAFFVKSKVLWGVVALLIAGLGYLLWDDGVKSSPRTRGAVPADSDAPPVRERAAHTPAPEEKTTPPDETRAPHVGLFVVVHLEEGAAVPVTLTVAAGANQVEAPIVVGRQETVDVGSLFESDPPTEVSVSAVADGYVVAKRRLTVQQRDERPSLPRFEVTLRRARVVVGVARGPRGEEAGLFVAGFRLRNGVPEETAIATATVHADGHYALAFEDEGDYLVVLHKRRVRPAMRTVRVRGLRTEAPAVDLALGERVRGRVTGVDARGHAGADVLARRRAPGHKLSIPDAKDELLWAPDRIELSVTNAKADAEGRYEIAGLTAGEYQIEVASVPSAHFGTFQADGGARYRRVVTAPAEGVDFEVPVVAIELLVAGEGQPVDGATVFVTEHRGGATFASSVTTDADGRSVFMVGAEASYVLEISAKRYEKKEHRFTSVNAGQRQQVSVGLEPATQKATLVVQLHAPRAGPLPVRCLFTLTPVAGRNTEFIHARASADGYLLRNIKPGSYRLQFIPGDPREGGFLMSAEERVDLVGGVHSNVTLRPDIGGRVVLHVHDPDGQTKLKGTLEFSTRAGKHVRLSVMQRRGKSSTATSDRLPGLGGPVYVSDPIPAGHYRVRVVPAGDALAERTVEFEVKSGNTTDVQVPLERR